MSPKKYLRYFVPANMFGTSRTKDIVQMYPSFPTTREEADKVKICIYDYDAATLQETELHSVEEAKAYKDNHHTTWINLDGLRKKEVEQISEYFDIHPLLTEDILSINQRPKLDEMDNLIYCLLYMLYYNDTTQTVEHEQISIVMGKGYVITFQEFPKKDVFNPLRDKLKMANSTLRQRGADYLCYSMLDMIVDNYFVVMEKLGERIEALEEDIINNSNSQSLALISQLRKEMIVLKRNITPVRDLISSLMRSDSPLLDKRTIKYFKDIYDHIIQAYDLSENYRDLMMNMHDLYINSVNLKMNESMKVMAVVTCLLAPATVIGGIFGMNFQRIPLLHNRWGFYISVALMLLIPIWMLRVFKRKGWF